MFLLKGQISSSINMIGDVQVMLALVGVGLL